MKRLQSLSFIIVAVFAVLSAHEVFAQATPEPAGWYAGDMHVHRSCGASPESVSSVFTKMNPQNLAAISLLADIGNGEVQNPVTDLPLVNGQDAPISTPGRILHWDTEWHWDATYNQYPHQALGGHIVTLGTSNAHQIWEEYTGPIFDWAHQQNGIAGFAHLQYLNNGFPQSLTCCTPIEYPVEVALGSADFISEDVDDLNSGTGGMQPESFTQSYYRLLNSGFRPGFSAGTDYPCNGGSQLGSLLTYVQVAGGQMSYRNWIDGISKGRTVVSRNGHNEFLNLTVNGTATPGDEIQLPGAGNVQVTVQWTAIQNLSGTIELVQNGTVVASRATSAGPGAPGTLTATVNFAKSGWLAARRMAGTEHAVHTAAVFVTVGNAPVRASATDAQFYVDWMNGLLQNTSPGGVWNSFFPTSLNAAQARYQDAKALYQQIVAEANGSAPTLTSIAVSPVNQTIPTGGVQQFIATGTYSNGTTLNITGQTRWTSSNPLVASVNLRGVASAVNSGTATVSASLSGVTGSTPLTVQAGSIVITTQALSGGTVGVPYSATLAASGGAPPYTWSISSGSLPAGLSLNSSTGGIDGTPATVGTFTFTVQASDSSNPQQNATKSLSIVITSSTGTLAITTQALAGGTVGASYSATLAASGGLQPYTWSIATGSLPPGLTLDGTGAITGVPTTVGTFGFTVRVTDSGSPQQNVTKSLSIVITSSGGTSCPCTIWPSNSIPGRPDSGPDSAVEIGVRFRSDINGSITGIRFYKGAGNTGAHVGNLWSSSGTRLATATFSGETASGWQQVNFPTPVTITANITYVASYFAPTGHYAADSGFFAATAVDNAPLHALLNGQDGGNGVYAYGASSAFPNSTFQATNYWVDVVFATTTGPDTTPPSVTTVSPANGASGVSPSTAVSVTFSEPINSATITGSTFQLSGPGSTLVSASVTYNPASLTATLTPASALATSTSYTAVVTGGTNGIKDVAGNAMTSNFTWSFTTAATAPPAGSSIWSPTTVPTEVDSGDPGSLELGVRFRSDINGSLTGIRFYKASTNIGTHIANLWTNTGTLLATATFTGESASGWQQVSFSAPVAITAGTTYVASYFAPSGHYSDSSNYFASTGADNPPLHALRTGVDGLNGVYNYSPTSSFPISMWQATNYWVDVVFVPTSNTTPPTVTSVTPAANSSGASLGGPVTAGFSEPMNPSTINENTFVLLDPSNNTILSTVTYNSATATAVLTPIAELKTQTTYTAVVKSGTNGVKDSNGNALANDFSWSFTTGGTPADSGPGGPILVIANVVNPFSRYYGEILSAEGMNEYTVSDISKITPAILANYDVVILGDMSLTAAQVSMLTNWVTNGGNLIAMHPDMQLASLLGLTPRGTTLANAYLLVQTSTGPGVGIVGQTIQFHGTADLYALNGASSLATLYSNPSVATTSPAVTLVNVGAGQAAAFAYDLARSIVYTRQGNPAWSGQARDGQQGPIRSDDLFFGNASFDPQPDWVNLNKVAIPQADEQQRFLANLILQMNADRKPLPRFWYFPSGLKAVVVMTGDDHGSIFTGAATNQRFNDYLAASSPGCSVADWQCVRGTSYLFPQALSGNTLTDSQAAAYTAQGFEVAVHVDSNPTCSNWTLAELDSQYTNLLASLHTQYPSLPPTKTHRMHCIGWSDYDSQPQVELIHGIRLDTTYYYWPASWINDQPGMFTGSGMPMRFTDRNGNLIDVYQAATQMTDESGQSYPFDIDELLDNALSPNGYYGAFVVNAHNDQGYYPGIAPDVVASAKSHAVPVISGLQLLTWLDGRNNSSFGSLQWSGNTLSFNITQANGARNLQAMLPTNGPNGALSSVTLNGNPVAFTTQTIKGVSYATFSANAGVYQAIYGGGAPTVVLSSIAVNPSSVVGGSGSTGTLTLSAAAPAGGAVVTLSSDNTTAATVPASVTVNSGGTSATFNVATSTVSTSTAVTIQGNYNGAKSTVLTVLPASVALASVSLNPTSVVGGTNSTGTVTLSGTAPTGGAVVALSSSNSAVASVPANVTVVAGNSSATFNVTTSNVASSTTVTIQGNYGAIKAATLTVTPAAVTASSLTLNPTSVTGGANSTGTVTLSAAAPTGGAAVSLQSSNTAAAVVPASVNVPAGSTSATFTITTSTVTAGTSVTITATLGVSRTATLVVNPPVLSTLTRTPTSVVGGNNSTGTVTLTGKAPAGGAVVTLSSSNTAAAVVPASVTVAAGATSATFTITTNGVATSTSSTITAVYGGVTRTTTLTVTVASLTSLTLNPTSVTRGSSSTGTVTLTGFAPPGGAVVALTSSNTAQAQVPSSIIVPSGARTASFTVTTSSAAAATVRISGTYRGTTRNATLTIQ